MSTVVSVGIDVGAQKTMIAKDDADIIRTDTGTKCEKNIDQLCLTSTLPTQAPHSERR